MNIVVDIETTGFSKEKNDLIHFAAVEVDNNYKILRTFEFFSRPKNPQYWNAEAEKIHCISLERAQCFPYLRKGLIDFLWWLDLHREKFPLNFVYHGKNKWDYNFVKAKFLSELLHESFFKAFNEKRLISTVEVAREIIPGMPNYRLNTLCEHFNIPLEHHQAMSDALATARLFRLLKTQFSTEQTSLFQ